MNKASKFTAILLTTALMSGIVICISSCYVPPVWDKYDVINRIDSIQPRVTTKKEVLQRFGKPDSQNPEGTFFQYTGWTDSGILFIPVDSPVALSMAYGQSRNQRTPWLVNIRFDENDIVTIVETSNDKYLLETHAQGIGKEAATYCPNADLGHADAQKHIGDIYYHGLYGLKVDVMRAWVWYSLASQNGDEVAKTRISSLTDELTPGQLEEAKRQLAEWKPGQCMQELKPN